MPERSGGYGGVDDDRQGIAPGNMMPSRQQRRAVSGSIEKLESVMNR